jgi:hypothetical protein
LDIRSRVDPSRESRVWLSVLSLNRASRAFNRVAERTVTGQQLTVIEIVFRRLLKTVEHSIGILYVKVGILDWAGDKGKGRMDIDFSEAALGHVEPGRAKQREQSIAFSAFINRDSRAFNRVADRTVTTQQ